MERNKSDIGFGTPGYAEFMIPVKANAKMHLVRAVIITVCAVLLLGLFSLTSKIPQIFAVWLLIIVFFAYMGFTFTKREFEYTISSGEFMLDVIYGSRKRRRVLSVRISSAERISPVRLPDTSVTSLADKAHIVYACNKDDENMYYMLYKKGNTDCLVFFSAPEKTVKCLKFYNRTALVERINNDN